MSGKCKRKIVKKTRKIIMTGKANRKINEENYYDESETGK